MKRKDILLDISLPDGDTQGFNTIAMEPGDPGKIWGPVPMHHLVNEIKQHPDVRIATHE